MEFLCSAALLPRLRNAHFLGVNGPCTTRGPRLLNPPNQLSVFCTPWTHCTGDEEVTSSCTGKLPMRNRPGRQDASGTIFKVCMLVSLLISLIVSTDKQQSTSLPKQRTIQKYFPNVLHRDFKLSRMQRT